MALVVRDDEGTLNTAGNMSSQRPCNYSSAGMWDTVYDLPDQAMEKIMVWRFQGYSSAEIVDLVHRIYLWTPRSGDVEYTARRNIRFRDALHLRLEPYDIRVLFTQASATGFARDFAWHWEQRGHFRATAERYISFPPSRLLRARCRKSYSAFPDLLVGERERTEELARLDQRRVFIEMLITLQEPQPPPRRPFPGTTTAALSSGTSAAPPPARIWDTRYDLPYQAIERILVWKFQAYSNHHILSRLHAIYLWTPPAPHSIFFTARRFLRPQDALHRPLSPRQIDDLFAAATAAGLYARFAAHWTMNRRFGVLARRYVAYTPRRLAEARGWRSFCAFPELGDGTRGEDAVELAAVRCELEVFNDMVEFCRYPCQWENQ